MLATKLKQSKIPGFVNNISEFSVLSKECKILAILCWSFGKGLASICPRNPLFCEKDKKSEFCGSNTRICQECVEVLSKEWQCIIWSEHRTLKPSK